MPPVVTAARPQIKLPLFRVTSPLQIPDGKSSGIDQFKVSHDFDEGETVNMFKKFAGFDLVTKDGGWNYVYTGIIAMAEKDDGGFAKFLQELWDKVGDAVTAAVSGAVGAAVGAAIGAAMGGIIGAIVGFVLAAVILWLISLFDNQDEILGTRILTMTLAAATKSYYDWAKLTSSSGCKFELRYRGDGSNYRVRGCWRVHTA